MCERYTQTRKPEELLSRFGLKETSVELVPRFNIAPGQDAPVIINDGKQTLKMMKWGLVPSWAEDPTMGNKMINARSETISEKPSFKGLLTKRRCLVLADGLYEWSSINREKFPIRFVLKTREAFAFAGLWDSWKKPDGGELETFTIITTEASNVVRLFHNRMPVILKTKDEQTWLGVKDPGDLLALLKPSSSRMMESYPVSRLVNSPLYDTPDCILPVKVSWNT